MSGLPEPLGNKHLIWDPNWIASAARSFRNGIIIGARSRLPFFFQAAAYLLLYSDDGLRERLRSVVKMMFVHGYNLGSFVVIYKTICAALRSVNVNGGIESLVAGFIGGYYAFGESKGMSGAVNTQLVLYLLARAVQGTVQKGVQQKLLPSLFDWSEPTGFRVWAGITLALALYHTEYSAKLMPHNFMATMNFLYHESDSGPLVTTQHAGFWPFMIVVSLALLGFRYPHLGIEALVHRLL